MDDEECWLLNSERERERETASNEINTHERDYHSEEAIGCQQTITAAAANKKNIDLNETSSWWSKELWNA